MDTYDVQGHHGQGRGQEKWGRVQDHTRLDRTYRGTGALGGGPSEDATPVLPASLPTENSGLIIDVLGVS